VKSRKDKWTNEENHILEKIVLEHLQIGATKTAAFKKAASVLGRTSAACGYRWNHVLSKNDSPSTITPQLQLPPPKEYIASTLNLDTVIDYLRHLNNPPEELMAENQTLLNERNHLIEKHSSLKKSYIQKKNYYQKLLQQYESFADLLKESESIISERSIH